MLLQLLSKIRSVELSQPFEPTHTPRGLLEEISHCQGLISGTLHRSSFGRVLKNKRSARVGALALGYTVCKHKGAEKEEETAQ